LASENLREVFILCLEQPFDTGPQLLDEFHHFLTISLVIHLHLALHLVDKGIDIHHAREDGGLLLVRRRRRRGRGEQLPPCPGGGASLRVHRVVLLAAQHPWNKQQITIEQVSKCVYTSHHHSSL